MTHHTEVPLAAATLLELEDIHMELVVTLEDIRNDLADILDKLRDIHEELRGA